MQPGRVQVVVATAALTGLVVGLSVGGFEHITNERVLHSVLGAPLWQKAAAPAVGLAISALALRWLVPGGTTPSTADDFIANFHARRSDVPIRRLPARLIAGGATVGSGGAMGLEGPSIYLGSVVGANIQARFTRFFSREDAKLLLVAGAAAGVSAVFKAPATGVIFALEVPYRDDVARRALMPALIASASSYLSFVAVTGSTERLFSPAGSFPALELPELGGAVLVGFAAGLAARAMSMGVVAAKGLAGRINVWYRIAGAGAVLAVLAVLSTEVGGQTLTLGPGYDLEAWIVDSHALWVIAAIFVFRAAATITTLAGGGAGGLFIPLAVQGLLLGRFVAEVLDEPTSSLFPFIGLAAFLGAGYRTPMASVMFVAESTGLADFVVPALLAAAVSQLVMGDRSVSTVQQNVRAGHLERRFQLPLSTALVTDVLTVPPDATLSEFVFVHAIGNRVTAVPVVSDGHYLGMADLELVADVARDEWDKTPLVEITRTELPVGKPSWTLRDAIEGMDRADVDQLPVTDNEGRFVGVVTLDDILKLDEVLGQAGA